MERVHPRLISTATLFSCRGDSKNTAQTWVFLPLKRKCKHALIVKKLAYPKPPYWSF